MRELHVILVFFLLFLHLDAIFLMVHNIQVLEKNLVNNPLTIQLDVQNNRIPLEQIYDSKLCLMINGISCHCFEESYIALDLYLPTSCSQPTIWSYFWFSIQLKLQGNDNVIVSTPVKVINFYNNSMQNVENNKITFVLPLVLDDLSRSAVLFNSLKMIKTDIVFELLCFVPDRQLNILKPPILALSNGLNFEVKVLSENILFSKDFLVSNDLKVFSYATQMAIKLLASKIIKTEFYVTLDADIISLKSFNVNDIIPVISKKLVNIKTSSNDQKMKVKFRKGLFENESRNQHLNWWKGSSHLLQIYGNQTGLENGFGVTPSVLSTFGSLLTLQRLYSLYGINNEEDKEILVTSENGEFYSEENDKLWAKMESYWLNSFGRNPIINGLKYSGIWSEYTLYRLTLDYYKVFSNLHTLHGVNELPKLHCYNVWYPRDLPWPRFTIFVESIKNESLKYEVENCLFSVVQGSTGVSPGILLDQFSLINLDRYNF